jgi:hypothetical protein
MGFVNFRSQITEINFPKKTFLNMSIEKIHANFVSEAIAAKTLFADLAKVELYIAESYRARAFIELLQNADDAGAKKFIIRQVGDKLLVANDGRTFTSEDIVSLCRSGASTKQRGSGTIGYRGIGFKSVAGIATEVDVISGEYAFRFSKSATREAVGCEQDVPLIRIPHALSPNDAIWHVADEVRKLEHMTSIFVLSGISHRMIVSEANDFDESALLFLKCINEVDIEMPTLRRSLKRVASIADSGYSVERIGNGDSESHDWLVVSTPNGSEKLAFAFVDGRLAPTDRAHAVIHAFMPTLEYSGAFLKINGDFSTDPSRKSVDIDELSSASLERSLDLLADLARTAVTGSKLSGFFSPFLSTAPHEGRFRKLLQLGLSQRLSSIPLQLGTRTGVVADIRLAPDWLTYNDFETLCQDLPHAPMTVLAVQPEISEFLRWLGSKILNARRSIKTCQSKAN